MSKGDNSPGVSRLAGVVKKIAKGTTAIELALDLGEIQSDGSLLTDDFPLPIPKSEYQVGRCLGHDDHKLKKGARVLVAWVGSDAVVIDVVVSADSVL